MMANILDDIEDSWSRPPRNNVDDVLLYRFHVLQGELFARSDTFSDDFIDSSVPRRR